MRVISLLSTLPLAALASSDFKVQIRSSNSSGLDSLSSSNSSSSQSNSTDSSSTSNSTSNGLPYETPDISQFKPSKGADVAGDYSSKLCAWVGENLHNLSSQKITEAFGQVSLQTSSDRARPLRGCANDASISSLVLLQCVGSYFISQNDSELFSSCHLLPFSTILKDPTQVSSCSLKRILQASFQMISMSPKSSKLSGQTSILHRFVSITFL